MVIIPDSYLDTTLERGPKFSYKEVLEGDEQTLMEVETVLELASKIDGHCTYESDNESIGMMVTSEVLEQTLETLYQAYIEADGEREDEIQSIFSRYGFEDYMEPDQFDIDWEPESQETDRSVMEKVRDYVLNNKDEKSPKNIDKLGKAGEYDGLIDIVSRYEDIRDTGVTEEEVERAFSYLKEDEEILLEIAKGEDARTVRERAAVLLAKEGYDEEVIELIDDSNSSRFVKDISREMLRDGHTEVLKDAFTKSVNEGPYGLEDTEIVEAFFIEEEFDEIQALAENADERMMREILAAGRESEKGDKAKEMAREKDYHDLLESFKI